MSDRIEHIIINRRNHLKSLLREEITRDQKLDGRSNKERIHELTHRLDELSILESRIIKNKT